ncbi:endonuclease/exonuclease/phosphatase family protein [Rhizobium sp. TRM96647]|uniref:endonuclease/exonuclease/phosphatase family protein n=1 Tax=unclassified Rhizobium TaxID=2613769 RepID=UPI0021E85E60|nr:MULTISPECIES: endonuclease/exonuclease/phosphatase family protein [unclassified Rhizobium]MCV3738571.1 endonuclease/exonuclease/phosphatase family protein [Rhizobium sp. TRM96647]MCV3760258.1 endonuclease/exonuclease/phosphatase family protein [Rhizobium sp. TRM96650]
MIVSCWNAQWHPSSTRKGARIIERLLRDDPEIVCCPEAFDDFLPEGWHGLFSEPDYGYPIMPGRHKVTLWSRTGWSDVDCVGSSRLPGGRFVAGTTATSTGVVRVIGVCIPWKDAHVRTGNRNRQPWEDHASYLNGLRSVVAAVPDIPTLIIGDFNQRLPRRRSPVELYSQLTATLEQFDIWTTGAVPGLEHPPVCHIGGSKHFSLARMYGYPKVFDGLTISDHDGLAVDIEAA